MSQTHVTTLTPITGPLIGSDESGKVDYSGPSDGCCPPGDAGKHATLIEELAVRNSKSTGDAVILRAGAQRRPRRFHALTALPPEDDNRAYVKERNLDTILGRAHARRIEQALEHADCQQALAVDSGIGRFKFATVAWMFCDERSDECSIVRAVVSWGRRLRLEQRTQPRGATNVAAAARSIITRLGWNAFGRFTKLRFKTTERVLGIP